MQRQRDQCATLKSNILIADSDLKTRMKELEIVKKKCDFLFIANLFILFMYLIEHQIESFLLVFSFHFLFFIFHFHFFSLLLKEEIAENAQLQLAEVSFERQRLRDTSEALETQLKNVLHARYVCP